MFSGFILVKLPASKAFYFEMVQIKYSYVGMNLILRADCILTQKLLILVHRAEKKKEFI